LPTIEQNNLNAKLNARLPFFSVGRLYCDREADCQVAVEKAHDQEAAMVVVQLLKEESYIPCIYPTASHIARREKYAHRARPQELGQWC
jgi:hypothetical protein